MNEKFIIIRCTVTTTTVHMPICFLIHNSTIFSRRIVSLTALHSITYHRKRTLYCQILHLITQFVSVFAVAVTLFHHSLHLPFCILYYSILCFIMYRSLDHDSVLAFDPKIPYLNNLSLPRYYG